MYYAVKIYINRNNSDLQRGYDKSLNKQDLKNVFFEYRKTVWLYISCNRLCRKL